MTAGAPKPRTAPRPPVDLKPEELGRLAAHLATARLLNEERKAQGLDPLPLDSFPKQAGERNPNAPPPAVDVSQVSAALEADGRTRFKLQLWRQRTTIAVELNADTGDLMAWREPRLAREEGGRSITEREAVAAASAAVELPADCGTPDAVLVTTGPVPAWEVSWVHLVGPDGDVVVEGDKILVRVNASTGKVFSAFKKWRAVPPTPAAE